MKKAFLVKTQHQEFKKLELQGRLAWALENLVRARQSGCTPIDTPGPRWSGYVHNLRRDYSLDIETVTEPHKGPFPGTHARYVLKSHVRPVDHELD